MATFQTQWLKVEFSNSHCKLAKSKSKLRIARRLTHKSNVIIHFVIWQNQTKKLRKSKVGTQTCLSLATFILPF